MSYVSEGLYPFQKALLRVIKHAADGGKVIMCSSPRGKRITRYYLTSGNKNPLLRGMGERRYVVLLDGIPATTNKKS